MSAIDKINCKLGKHKWEKAYVKDNKYEAWVCPICGAKRYNVDMSKIGVKEDKK